MSAGAPLVWVTRLVCMVMLPAAAMAQMPDARQMSGIPMPASDVPSGSVTVRLVRGDISNNIVGHRVELHVGARVQTANTDENGRAVFTGIEAGSQVRALAVIDGERLESQNFTLPQAGGVRLVLAAGVGPGTAGAARGPGGTGATGGATPPVAPGEIVFAGDSRIQIEFDDDTLEVFYLFDLVNPASTPIHPKTEMAFELPEGAEQAAMLEGSSTQATVRGRSVSISGPFAPGVTPVQLAFSLAPAGPDRILVQKLPVTWARVQVVMTRAGLAKISSPQFANASEMADGGGAVMLGAGGALAANREMTLSLTGLPSRSHVGRYLALALAGLVLILGAYAAMSGGGASGDVARRAQLVERRDRLMADLVRVEEQYRAGVLVDVRYATRRAELVDQLERIYGELDSRAGAADQGQG